MVYSFIMGTALLGVWKFNLDHSYADMYFRLAQHYVDAPGDKLENQIIGSSSYITAIRHEPRQDLYYLNLGRSLMAIAVMQYQKKNRRIGEPKPEIEVENLLQLTDKREAKEFLLYQSPASLMKYAEAVLLRAHELNPLNKEYLVNLGRMYNLWYNHLTKELRYLALSEDWFRRAHTVAPQDVIILSEYVSTILQRLTVAQSQNDTEKAAAAIQEATVLLAKAQQLDPDYLETQIRLADLYRLQGDISRALDLYMDILEKNPHALDGRIVVIIEALHDKPEAMARLRSAYETVLARKIDDPMLHSIVGLIATRTGDLQRAAEAFGKQTELEPTDIKARQAYTLILLNLKRYDEAVISAQKLVEITQQYGATDQQKNNAHQLLQLAKMRSGRN